MTASRYVSRHLSHIPKKGQKEIPANRVRLETYLKNELSKLKKLHVGLTDDAHTFALLERKISDKPVRAYFAGEVYAFVQRCVQQEGLVWKSGEQRLFQRVIPFVLEVVISIQYFHNQILDSKAGVTCRNKKQIDQNLLSANLLKEYLYEYIDQEAGAEEATIITRYVRRIFKYVDIGQQIEKQWNTHKSYQQGTYRHLQLHEAPAVFTNPEQVTALLETLRQFYPERSAYLETYLRRIALTSAALFALSAEMIVELSGYTGKARQQLLDFAWFYGMMQQVINDNADMVPSRFNHETSEKTASDAFSDLRNHNVTLPLFLHLENLRHETESQGSDLVKNILQGPFHAALSSDDEEQLFSELKASGALYLSIDIGKYFGAMAQTCLVNSAGDCQTLLALCEVAEWNRYIYDCYNKKDPHNKRLRKQYKASAQYSALASLIAQAKRDRETPESTTPSGNQILSALCSLIV